MKTRNQFDKFVTTFNPEIIGKNANIDEQIKSAPVPAEGEITEGERDRERKRNIVIQSLSRAADSAAWEYEQL